MGDIARETFCLCLGKTGFAQASAGAIAPLLDVEFLGCDAELVRPARHHRAAQSLRQQPNRITGERCGDGTGAGPGSGDQNTPLSSSRR